jgi:hypothetical protein
MQNQNFTFVLYGHETLTTLREGRRLRMFENRLLRRIFGYYRESGSTLDENA